MEKKILSTILFKELAIDEILSLRDRFGYGKFSSSVSNKISIYKMVYQTDYMGKIIEASGLIMVPSLFSKNLAIVCVQNGTTFLKSEAPTLLINHDFSGYEFFSADGYITLIPDYIGYGSSSDCIHPYYDAKHSASCVIDFILACQDFLLEKSIPINHQLFLTGFSEGGYITMATLKELEHHNPTIFNIEAVAAGAGGFDLFAMLHSLSNASNSSHFQPAYIVYLIMAYNHIYQWEKPLSHYFSLPSSEIIPELFNGVHDKEYINNHLGSDLSRLFNPNFYLHLFGQGELAFKKAIFLNTLSNWCPASKLNLYHGLEDDVIPYENTELTFQKFIENGAKNTSIVLLEGLNHSTTLLPMLEQVKPWFDSLKK
ncbi:MAG: hypothetical protein EAZ07_07575 [Cytophagales bacterium]|nr:MAG: hypothetical protein EAZ07_07575 [Cytophagales bacterium]